MSSVEEEHIINQLMKSDAAQEMLEEFRYCPRYIRMAIERILFCRNNNPGNITKEILLQELKIMAEEKNMCDDDLKIRNPNNVINEDIPKSTEELRHEISTMRKKMQCECGDPAGYVSMGCNHLLCNGCAMSESCMKCGSVITHVVSAKFAGRTN